MCKCQTHCKKRNFIGFAYLFLKQKIRPKYVKSHRILRILLQFYGTRREGYLHEETRINLAFNGLVSVFVSIIKNSTGRNLVGLQATLTLTAPHAPFVPPCIHNLLIFPTDCSCVALGTNIHSQVCISVCRLTH